MLGAARLARMKREMTLFDDRPPHGISCWVKEETIGRLEAQIIGGEDTPYIGGIFTLDIHLPDRYPFEPPKITFVTPIYHPNVDTGGRICLESLKMPPAGAWSPVLNVVTVLTTIQHLMSEPNPDDPLMADIAKEFKYNRAQYEQNARLWTRQHAMNDKTSVNVPVEHPHGKEFQSNAEKNIEQEGKVDDAGVLQINDNVVCGKRVTDVTHNSASQSASKRICAARLSVSEHDTASTRFPVQLKENRLSSESGATPNEVP